jgi:hypothetical protein
MSVRGGCTIAWFHLPGVHAMLLALVLAMGAASAHETSAGEDVRLKAIIQGVREGEDLFRNLDLIYKQEAELLVAPEKLGGNLLKKGVEDYHLIKQGELYYIHELKKHDYVNGPLETDFQMGYDGTITRSITRQRTKDGQSKGLGNITHGRLEQGYVLEPYRLGARFTDHKFSQVLDGSFLRDPQFKNVTRRIFIEGEETVGGQDCLRLVQIFSSQETGEVEKYIHWLAVDEHYLPARTWYYTCIGKELSVQPLTTYELDEWREIGPGVRIPYKAVKCVFRPIDGQLVQSSREIVTITKASLSPAYDLSKFKDVPFPAGAVIYVIRNGKTVESYIQPGDEGIPEAEFSVGRWILSATGLVVIIVGSWMAYRRGKKIRASQPETS